jgi:hypothetical protein
MPISPHLYAEHGAFVPIGSHSQLRLRNRLEGMATMFRREFQFDRKHRRIRFSDWSQPI